MVLMVPKVSGKYFAQNMNGGGIYVIAGNAQGTYCFDFPPCGDNGLGTGALLFDPTGLAVDAAGNIFIADSQDNAVRFLSASTGIISLYAGNYTACTSTTFCGDGLVATSANLDAPSGVAWDPAISTLYIADSGDNVIRAVHNGVINTVAGQLSGGCSSPSTCGDTGLAAQSRMTFPLSVAVDGSGNVYIADTDDNAVRMIAASNGTFFGYPMAAGHIYDIAGNYSSCSPSACGDGANGQSAEVPIPYSVLTDNTTAGGSPNVYVASPGLHEVRLLAGTSPPAGDSTGSIYPLVGKYLSCPTISSSGCGDGNPPTSAYVSSPEGLATDASGSLYIADTGDFAVRMATALTAGPSGGTVRPLSGAALTNAELPVNNASEACVSQSQPQTQTTGKNDPVDPENGSWSYSSTLLSIPNHAVPLQVTLSYTTALAPLGNPTPFQSQNGWNSSAFMRLVPNDNDGTTQSGWFTVVQENGAEVSFQQNGSAYTASSPRIEATLGFNSTTQQYAFNRHGRTTFYFDGNPSDVTYGELLKEADPNGYFVADNYSTAGVLQSLQDQNNRTLTIGYDSSGRLHSVADQGGRTAVVNWNSANQVSSIVDAANDTTSFTAYDAQNRVENMTTPLEQGSNPLDQMANTYYTSGAYAGQLQTHTDPAQLQTRYSYTGDPSSATGGATIETDSHGNQTQYNYIYGQLASKVQGYGQSNAATTSYLYDPTCGATSQVTDPNGHVTTYSYDAAGNMLQKVDPLGNTTTWGAYNSFDEPSSMTDPVGVVTAYTYDADANLTQKTVNALSSRCTTGCQQLTHYAVCEVAPPATTCSANGSTYTQGELESVTDPRGYTTVYTHDTYGDPASSTDPAGDKTVYAYDADGRLYCTVAPKQVTAGDTCAAYPSHGTGTTSYILDGDNHVTSMINPDGNQTQYGYDADGNQNKITDATGHITTSTYDGDDRLTNKTTGYGTAAAQPVTTSYDIPTTTGPCSTGIAGNATYCTTTTNGDSQVTVDFYNDLDQEVQISPPASLASETKSYDGAGNLLTDTTGGGTTTYTYYPNNQVQTETPSNAQSGYQAASATSYHYDSDGLRTQMTDGTGTTSYVYDGYERLSSTQNGAGSTIGYGYDLDNDITSITYPNNKTVTRGYDNADRLHTVEDWNNQTTTITPDANSNTSTITDPASTDTDTYTYDNANFATSAAVAPTGSTASSLTYTPNNDEQVGAVSAANLPGPASASYGYNASNDLTTDSATGGAYNYDAAGNPTGLANGTNQAFNTASEECDATPATPSCSTPPARSAASSYDSLGDRTSTSGLTGTASYSYNQLGQLTGATPAPATSSYTATAPTRICDTRPNNPSNLSGADAQCNGTNNSGETFNGQGRIIVQVSGTLNGTSLPVPANATAVVANITALNHSTSGGGTYITIYPTGTTMPSNASNLNVAVGTTGNPFTTNNQVTAKLGTTSSGAAAITIFNDTDTVDVVVDVVGYYTQGTTGQTYAPNTPTRICDTRTSSPTNQCTGKTLGAHTTLTVQAAGTGFPNQPGRPPWSPTSLPSSPR